MTKKKITKKLKHTFEIESGFSKGDIFAYAHHEGFVDFERVEEISKNIKGVFTIWGEGGTGWDSNNKDLVRVGHLSDNDFEVLLNEAEGMASKLDIILNDDEDDGDMSEFDDCDCNDNEICEYCDPEEN